VTTIGGDNLGLGDIRNAHAAVGAGAQTIGGDVITTSEAHLLMLRDLITKIDGLAVEQRHFVADQQAMRVAQEAMAQNLVNFRQESLRAWNLLDQRQASGERRIAEVEKRQQAHETRLDGLQKGIDRVDGRAERWLRYIIIAALLSSPIGMIAVALIQSALR
jgi:hypothetical protein